MIRPILRHGADVLHRPALPVDALTPDIQQLIDDMVQTMYAAPGVGLAATQVGRAGARLRRRRQRRAATRPRCTCS